MKTKLLGTAAALIVSLVVPVVPAAAVTTPIEDVAHSTVTGSERRERLGLSVAPAGDYDGDGVEDVIVGGRQSAFVVFGGSAGDVSTGTGSGLVHLDVQDFDRKQVLAVAGAGDVDGDGFDDVLVGAPRTDPFDRKNAGSAYLVYGRAEHEGLVLGYGSTPGVVTIAGALPTDRTGTGVAAAGDADGDGTPDVVVGARGAGRGRRGAAYVLSGAALDRDLDLAELDDEGYRIHDPAKGRDVGFSVAGAGDMNADGIGDVVVGAPSELVIAPPSVYVVFGRRTRSDVRLRDLGARGFAISAGDDERQEGAGEAVAGGEDVNGDGVPDVAIGAPHAMGRYGANGAVYVVFGKGDTSPVSLAALGPDGYVVEAGDESVSLGSAVALAPDLDGNGFGDVLAGDPWERGGAGDDAKYGAAYHLVGQASTEPVDLGRLGSDGMRYAGAGGRTGVSVGTAGDFDGDGKTDLAAGSPSTEVAGDEDAGLVHLFTPVAPPAYDRPPEARLVSYETSQRALYGSYCWDGLCADRRPTFPRRRKAGTGDRAHFRIMLDEEPDDVALTAYRELDEFGRPAGEGTPIEADARPFRYFSGAPVAGYEIVFRLPEEPGDLYLSAFARWDGLERGDVTWFSHLLLEDRGGHTNLSSPPSTVLESRDARQRGALSSYCWSNTHSTGGGVTQCSDYTPSRRDAEPARAGAGARIRIDTPHRPDRVRLRFYRDAEHGNPCCRARRLDFRMQPHTVDGEVIAWDVRFRLPERPGHVFPTLAATWDEHGTAPYDWHLLLR